MWVILGGFALFSLALAIWIASWAWKNPHQPAALRILAYLGSAFLLFMMVGCPAVLIPVFYQAKLAGDRTSCLQNMNLLSKAFAMYAGANDDRYPQANWPDAISQYVALDDINYPHLAGFDAYTMNESVVGLEVAAVADPASFILVFDGMNTVGGVGDVE